MTSLPDTVRPKIGLALGSGSARGWSHIGVLQALAEAGIEPDIVCGTSIGALVGGVYAHGHLDAFAGWVRRLTRRDVLGYMDLAWSGGGVLEGERLMQLYRDRLGDVAIQDLAKPFAAVATNLNTGQEVWLQDGSLIDAMRASISLPGLFKPVARGDHWLVDGGLVNPVPVTLCRALGAHIVIAVNLNGDLVGRHLVDNRRPQALTASDSWLDRLLRSRRDATAATKTREAGVGFFEVLASSLNIMQDRITRSRMAGDPPDIILSPRLGHLELLDFARGDVAIEEGFRSVRRMLPLIQDIVGGLKEA